MNKKFLKITGIMVLVIALAGFWGYTKYFAADPEIEQELNSQFGSDFFKFEDEEVVNISEADNPGKSVNDTVDQSDDSLDAPLNEATPSTPVNQTNGAKGVTQEEINHKYKPQFTYLQNLALSRLDSLYSAAIQEYEQRRKAGTLKRAELAKKYLQAGTMLEDNVDSKFYSTLDAMQAELKANNLPTNGVEVIKSDYEKAKSNLRSELLGKALK